MIWPDMSVDNGSKPLFDPFAYGCLLLFNSDKSRIYTHLVGHWVTSESFFLLKLKILGSTAAFA